MAEIHHFPPAGEPPGDDAIQFGEDTLALQFADLYNPCMRYVAKWGQWKLWNGFLWLPDDTLDVFDKARAICRVEAGLAKAKARSNNPDAAGRKLLDAKVIAAVERLARSDRRLAATTEQWDADPWMINTPEGPIDLRTGGMRDPEPLDYMTKATAVAPRQGPMPIFEEFLHTITGGDVDLQAYLQRSLGYCLTGLTLEQVLFFWYGTGANGKSVLISTISGIMGDYAQTAAMDLFIEKKHAEHSTSIAGLIGSRLVSVSETEKGAKWAESKLKSLTGGDKISAHFMRQDYFEFTPQFKLLIAGNHKPSIRGVDEAMRRRLHLVPFSVTIPAEQRDAELVERLKEEWPQILDWMITGCLAWQQYRLAQPECVVNATEGYMETEDALGQWLLECCDQKASSYTLASVLFKNWRIWAENNGEWPGGTKSFSQSLEDRGFKRKKQSGTGQRGFIGIELNQDQTPTYSNTY